VAATLGVRRNARSPWAAVAQIIFLVMLTATKAARLPCAFALRRHRKGGLTRAWKKSRNASSAISQRELKPLDWAVRIAYANSMAAGCYPLSEINKKSLS
jgi:hypothetical protein